MDLLVVLLFTLLTCGVVNAGRSVNASISPDPATPGTVVTFLCETTKEKTTVLSVHWQNKRKEPMYLLDLVNQNNTGASPAYMTRIYDVSSTNSSLTFKMLVDSCDEGQYTCYIDDGGPPDRGNTKLEVQGVYIVGVGPYVTFILGGVHGKEYTCEMQSCHHIVNIPEGTGSVDGVLSCAVYNARPAPPIRWQASAAFEYFDYTVFRQDCAMYDAENSSNPVSLPVDEMASFGCYGAEKTVLLNLTFNVVPTTARTVSPTEETSQASSTPAFGTACGNMTGTWECSSPINSSMDLTEDDRGRLYGMYWDQVSGMWYNLEGKRSQDTRTGMLVFWIFTDNGVIVHSWTGECSQCLSDGDVLMSYWHQQAREDQCSAPNKPATHLHMYYKT